MVQILSGLITHLLLAIYCHEEHGESISIIHVRQLRNQIGNEAMLLLAANLAEPRKRATSNLRRKMRKTHASS